VQGTTQKSFCPCGRIRRGMICRARSIRPATLVGKPIAFRIEAPLGQGSLGYPCLFCAWLAKRESIPNTKDQFAAKPARRNIDAASVDYVLNFLNSPKCNLQRSNSPVPNVLSNLFKFVATRNDLDQSSGPDPQFSGKKNPVNRTLVLIEAHWLASICTGWLGVGECLIFDKETAQ